MHRDHLDQPSCSQERMQRMHLRCAHMQPSIPPTSVTPSQHNTNTTTACPAKQRGLSHLAASARMRSIQPLWHLSQPKLHNSQLNNPTNLACAAYHHLDKNKQQPPHPLTLPVAATATSHCRWSHQALHAMRVVVTVAPPGARSTTGTSTGLFLPCSQRQGGEEVRAHGAVSNKP
jgi:hypothetical protein